MRSAAAATAAPPPTPESMSTDEEQAARRRERLPRTPPESEESEQSEAIERDAQEEPERLAFPLKAFFVACTSALEAVALTEAKRLVATGTANAKLALPKWTHPLIAGDLKDATALAAAALMGHVSVVRYLVGELGADARDVKLAAIRTEQTMKTETETITGSRALCKSGEVWSYEGKKGTLTMNPDSDNEVKLRWLSGGDTSSYIRTSRLKQDLSKEIPCTETVTEAVVMTLLELACRGGHLPTVQFLVSSVSAFEDSSARDRLLVNHKRLQRDVEAMHRAFAFACCSNSDTSLQTIQYLIETLNVDPNHSLPEWSCVSADKTQTMSGTGVTAFGASCVAGPAGAIEVLLDKCLVDLTCDHFSSLRVGAVTIESTQCSPLVVSILHAGDMAAVLRLSSQIGIDLSAPLAGMGGCTAISLAIEAGKLEIVRHLAEVHAVDLASPMALLAEQCTDAALPPSLISPMCKRGHTLIDKWTGTSNGWTCDGPHGPGAICGRFRCGECDYDLCDRCFDKLCTMGAPGSQATKSRPETKGTLPLHLAIDKGYLQLAEYIEVTTRMTADFVAACTADNEQEGLAEAKRLVAAGGVNPNRPVTQWTHPAVVGELQEVTALAAALLMGHMSVVRYLAEELGVQFLSETMPHLAAEFDICTRRNPLIYTPVPTFFAADTSGGISHGMLVSVDGRKAKVLTIDEDKSVVNIQWLDTRSSTAEILTSSQDVNTIGIQVPTLTTPLELAVTGGQHPLVQFVLEKMQSQPHALAIDRALALACMCGNTMTVKYLMDKTKACPNSVLTGWSKFCINRPTCGDQTQYRAQNLDSFAIALVAGNCAVVRHLVEVGFADLQRDHFENMMVGDVKLSPSVLALALCGGDVATVEYIARALDADLNKSIRDEFDNFPILLGIQFGQSDLVKYLVERLQIDFTARFESSVGEVTMAEYARHVAKTNHGPRMREVIEYLESLINNRTWALLRKHFQPALIADVAVACKGSSLLLDEMRDLLMQPPSDVPASCKLLARTKLVCWGASIENSCRVGRNSVIPDGLPEDIAETVASYVLQNIRMQRCEASCGEEFFDSLAASESMQIRRDDPEFNKVQVVFAGTVLRVTTTPDRTLLSVLWFGSEAEVVCFRSLFAPVSFCSEMFCWRQLQLRKRWLSDADWCFLLTRTDQIEDALHAGSRLSSADEDDCTPAQSQVSDNALLRRQLEDQRRETALLTAQNSELIEQGSKLELMLLEQGSALHAQSEQLAMVLSLLGVQASVARIPSVAISTASSSQPLVPDLALVESVATPLVEEPAPEPANALPRTY